MVYKRNVNSIKDMRKQEYIVSNNQGLYMNTSVMGENFAPYHGLFIKQEQKNDAILLAKITEELDFGGNDIYSIKDYKTSEKTYGGSEYLVSFDNNPSPTYTYDINSCTMEKKYKVSKTHNMLCIDYTIMNKTTKAIKFSATPFTTKRGIFDIIRASDMKFTTTSGNNTVKVNLSISENINLYMKSPTMKFIKKPTYETGINYDLEIEPGNIKTYVEDLYIPGHFEAIVKGGHTATLTIYVALYDLENIKVNSYQIEQECIDIQNDKLKNIDENFYELRSLAEIAYSLHYIDAEKKKLVLLEGIPMPAGKDTYIKNIISSIEGNYLVLKRYKEAFKILESMMFRLKDYAYDLNIKDRCEAELLFIEAVNRYIQESECRNSEVKSFYEYIKDTMFKYIDGTEQGAKMDKDFLLSINGKKYIKHNALWYNALRIFMFLQDKFYDNSEYIYSISENVRNSIVQKFWIAEKAVLKYELTEDAYSNFDMIYTLSLSYPALHESIAMKIIDTAFKELYTPLGMRTVGVKYKENDGYIYPHLMVHFLKANLRQMGVTRATQKLGYNLVKDLLAEINKDVIGTVKYKYYEKDKKAYGYPVSALTNAELIRMFDLLT